MDPEWFQNELMIILIGLLHNPFEALVSARNNRAAEDLDWIMPTQSLLSQIPLLSMVYRGVEGDAMGDV